MRLRILTERLRSLVLTEAKEKKYKAYTLYASSAPHRNEWSVEAYLGKFEQRVGEAEFAGVYEYDDDHPSGMLVALKGWNVEVHPDHRRKGLAAAMYQFAEETFKLPIQAGDFQTPEGGAFLKGKKGA